MHSKEEIKQKYGITEINFQIFIQKELPSSDSLLKEETFIEKKGFWDGFEVWLKKTIVGNVVLAVIFIGSLISGIETICKYGNIIYTNREQITYYVDHFAQYAKGQAKGFLVHTEMSPSEEDKKHQDMVIFPTGSLVYPISGDWRPN